MFRWVKSRLFFLAVVLLVAAFMSWKGAYTWRVDFEFPWWGYGAVALPLLAAGGMLLARRLNKAALPGAGALWVVLLLSFAVDSICNLYAFDAGALSGWMYSVNGVFPNYGCSQYVLQAGDVIQWHYTCDLGADLGTNQ